jgi:hypothetical protein
MMEICDCPECGAAAVVETEESYDSYPGDTVRVRCVARHWFLGPRDRLVPRQTGSFAPAPDPLPAPPTEPCP